MFPLVHGLADDGYDVAVTCRVPGVRRQGYYTWRSGVESARAEENELLLKHIETIHEESCVTYRWPRVHVGRHDRPSGPGHRPAPRRAERAVAGVRRRGGRARRGRGAVRVAAAVGRGQPRGARSLPGHPRRAAGRAVARRARCGRHRGGHADGATHQTHRRQRGACTGSRVTMSLALTVRMSWFHARRHAPGPWLRRTPLRRTATAAARSSRCCRSGWNSAVQIGGSSMRSWYRRFARRCIPYSSPHR